jgi:hypothetical protein
METEYVVKVSAANMPNSCWGSYARVAVLEIDRTKLPVGGPKMISERARGVIRVVCVWDRLNVGKTDRCAFRRAMRQAEWVAKMNNSDMILPEERAGLRDPYRLLELGQLVADGQLDAV